MADQLIDIPFPLKGLDVDSSARGQRKGTSPSLVNVRPFDPRSGRSRGSQRAGIEKYLDDQVNGDHSIQCIDHIVSANLLASVGEGSTLVGLTTGNAYRIYDSDGNSVASGGTSGNSLLAADWDEDGFGYEADVTGGSVTLRRMNSAGSVSWTASITAGFTVVLGSLWVHQGVVYLYLSGTAAASIYRYTASDGTGPSANPWTTHSDGILIRPNTLSLWNATAAASGGYFAIAGLVGGDLALRVYDMAAATISTTILEASPSNETDVTDVCGDDHGNFYVAYFTSTTAERLKKVPASGGVLWTNSDTSSALRSVCWDSTNGRLAVAGDDVLGTSHSFATVNPDTGAVIASSDAGSRTSWLCVRADIGGGFRLSHTDSTNSLVSLTPALAQDWTINISNFVAYRMAVNARNPYYLNERLAVREILGVAIAGGTLKRFDGDGLSSVSNGAGAFSAAAPIIFSAQFGDNLFCADGSVYRYYSSSDDAVQSWTPTAGTMPVDGGGNRGKLICNWRARIVLSGLRGDAQNWFMSAVNDPFDWNYSPDIEGPLQAVAGNNSEAGELGDVVNCLWPYSDDVLLMFGDHTVWRMSGDPADGGRIDLITGTVGGAWGRPVCMDSRGILYFFSSRCSVYTMTPGSLPERISVPIDNLLDGVDLDATVIRMAWDDRWEGFHLFVTPLDQTADATHWFWHRPSKSWWKDVFAKKAHNPKAVHVYDGDAVDDRRVLVGSWDGYVRMVEDSAVDDDGTAITSHVFVGPIHDKENNCLLLNDLQATLSEASDALGWSVHAAESPELALAASAGFSGTFAAGRNRSQWVRSAGHATFVKLANSTVSKTWSIDALLGRLGPTGPTRQRVF